MFMKVLKFGGSSVATSARIQSVIHILKPYLVSNTAVVFSAFGGVTDQLIEISSLAVAGDESYKEKLSALGKRHLNVVHDLVHIQRQSGILANVKVQLNELEDVLHGVFLVKERTLRTLDYILSFGERLSAYIINEVMRDQGIAASFLDARKVVRTDSNFGHAKVDFQTTNGLIQTYFESNPGLQIITGFIGASETGETTTLGRSGSDYTAAILAGALNATDLEIWTDVDGMMTADPRLVKKAFTVPEMSYEEAMELSHFGAKVIFPSTMQPAMANKIPIWIKNTFNPPFAGTKIHADAKNGKMVKGISSMKGISLLNIQGSGLLGIVGASMRVFASLAKANVNVILISQASSEHSICIAVEQRLAKVAKAAIEKEFQHEIRSNEVNTVQVQDEMSIVAVVGEGMKHTPGASGRLFSALGKNGINVSAIAQGSSERNISAVIEEADAAKALNALHEAFFLSDTRVLNLFVVGTGLIGSALIKMIQAQARTLAQEQLLEFNLIAVGNSRKMRFFDSGGDLATALDDLQNHGTPMNFDTYLGQMLKLNLPNSTFIDCTSSEEITERYQEILDANISIVTPNKKANSGSLEKYRRLRHTALRRGVKFLYETNVGAGLPVINTLNDLLLSGDKVIGIEGVLSGTLNYIFSNFSEGKKFSDVVREAKAKGYTEPDPRDDLSGTDVARKILILSREAGLQLELSDISIENLVPKSCRGNMSVDQFFSELEKHNDEFESLRRKACSEGRKLRYKAVLNNDGVKVILGSVADDHPFHSLSGSDNIILLTTERYHDRPMVIRGPGAGATVTAAGVFADIIRIGHYAR